MKAALQNYQRIFAPTHGSVLDRESLPTPLQYLTERNLLTGKARGAWASIRCPAHKAGGEENPSMRVNTIDGHYRCMACGEKGGDLVALHRLFTSLGFRDAVKDLGGRFHD